MNLFAQFSFDPTAKKLLSFVILFALAIAGTVFLSRDKSVFWLLGKPAPSVQIQQPTGAPVQAAVTEEDLKQRYGAVIKIEDDKFVPNQIQIKPGDEFAIFTAEKKPYRIFSTNPKTVLPVVDGANGKFFSFRPQIPENISVPPVLFFSLRPFDLASIEKLKKLPVLPAYIVKIVVEK